MNCSESSCGLLTKGLLDTGANRLDRICSLTTVDLWAACIAFALLKNGDTDELDIVASGTKLDCSRVAQDMGKFDC
jgi:hypothetical protein